MRARVPGLGGRPGGRPSLDPPTQLDTAGPFIGVLGVQRVHPGLAHELPGPGLDHAPFASIFIHPINAGLFIGIFVFVCILGLGGPTGIAANPARDMGPRLAHALLPIAGTSACCGCLGSWRAGGLAGLGWAGGSGPPPGARAAARRGWVGDAPTGWLLGHCCRVGGRRGPARGWRHQAPSASTLAPARPARPARPEPAHLTACVTHAPAPAGKGPSEFAYSWVPFLAPLAGGAIAGGLYMAVQELNHSSLLA